MASRNLEQLVEHGIEIVDAHARVDLPAPQRRREGPSYTTWRVFACARYCAFTLREQPRAWASGHGDTLLDGGRARLRRACKRRSGLGEYPRIAFSCARDHNGIATGFARDGHGIGAAFHVAVADHGHIHRLLDARDDAPVGTSAVQLLGVTTMHRNCGGSGILHANREFGRRFAAHGPTATELHGNGMLNRAAYRRHDGGGKVGIAHQRAAVAFRDDLGAQGNPMLISI